MEGVMKKAPVRQRDVSKAARLTLATVPPGRGLGATQALRAWLLSAVPPGQKHSPIEGLRIKLALMGL